MLTIDEIKNISFRKATLSGGYRAEDVDSFIDEVIASFEQLKKEKTNLVHKIDVLATRVEQYRADEETVRNALLASQKVSDACIKEAKEKAAKIVRNAEEKAQTLVADANAMTALEKENYLSLKADAVALRGELIELYKNHIKTIDDLPTSVNLEDTKKALDDKFPTNEVAQPAQETSDEENKQPQDTTTETNSDDEKQATAPEKTSSEPTETKDEPSDENSKDNTKASPRHGKFSQLKFGDNYDVSAE